MRAAPYPQAVKPTMYFIGVTTGQSSIMKVFHEWARALGFGDCAIRGMDFNPHDEPAAYRAAVEFIKRDPFSRGALVTTHKLDLLKACRDLFDRLDPLAEMMREVSSISKDGGRLVGHAKDPMTGGLALDAFLPQGHWSRTGAEAFIMGAGGSAVALSWYLMKKEHGANRPSRIIVSNRSRPRLDEIRELHARLSSGVPTKYEITPAPDGNDTVCGRLKPGSLVVNATGLGKDAPGSPLTDAAVFPKNGFAWEFNYRGDLVFLDQAGAQQEARGLTIEDGWIYFIHGWTRVIAEVFHVDIPTSGADLDRLSDIAAGVRRQERAARSTRMDPFFVDIDLATGEMRNPARHLVRRASDMKGHYADAVALDALIADGNPAHYEVFEVPVPEAQGHLMYCLSKLQPGRIGDEYFMTKGHYHKIAATAEIYLCLRGEGFMLMKTADGRCDAQRMTRGRMAYVPPHWAHRSVNIGREPLVSFCVYPAEAGHNYGDIETEGFPRRIRERDGKPVVVLERR